MTDWSLAGTYCGPAPGPPDLWLRWNLDPGRLVALALAAFLLRRSRPGLAGTAVLAFAFVSPLCALSAALFSARVVHHVLLVAIAAPLVALAWPARASRPATPAFLTFVGVLWAWHLPRLYDLALSDMAVYWLMQLMLLGSSVLFWRSVLRPDPALPRALLFTLAAYMQMGLLGALLTFAPTPLYAAHAVAPAAWGLTPLADQQLGGLVMWVPAGFLFAGWGVLVARRGWRRMAFEPA